jgi:poly(beta-D-mannuronate) C5 epimerase
MRGIFLIGFCMALALPVVAVEAPMAESPAQPGSATLDRDGYRLQEIAQAPALRDWEKEAQPQLALCSALPAAPAVKKGALHVTRLVKDRYFNKFFQGGGRLERLIVQQKGVPFAIVIDSGVWRPAQLAAALATEKGAFVKQKDGWLLRLPLLIREGAGLVLQDSESLRLSRDRGAFVINLGTLHLHKARIEAWDEQAGAPALAAPEDGAGFQPFLLGWSGSVTVIRESQVTGLGFAENLAHGLEFAVGPIGLAGLTLPAPPRVHVLDSSLDGLYSGVRGTSVPDLRVCRNHFTQSRLNAVHLDLGSSGVIAGNRITQTQGPYALYFSKSAQKVWVLGNDISENRRSGLSIADSSDLVFADNVIRQNFDAVFLQSSERILFADNRILDNQRHGVSMRNVGSVRFQGGRIGPNRGVGIMAVRAPAMDKAASLLKPSTPDGKPLPPARPRTPAKRHLELLGVALEGNHSSAMEVEAPYSLIMDRTDVLYPDVRRRPVFRGVLNGFESDILYRMPRQRTLQLMPLTQKTAGE